MGAESKEEVEGYPAEEDRKHGHPFEVLKECADEGFLPQTVAEDGETDVSEAGKDDEESDEDAPRFDVEAVDIPIIPADEEVVKDR